MYFTLLILVNLIISATFSQFLPINIASNSLITVNNWQKTSNYLLGLSAYSGVDKLYKNEVNQKLYNEQYGINSLGYGTGLADILPSSQSEAVSCCNTASGLKSYVSSGAACKRFQASWNQQTYGSEYYKESTTFESFLYLYDFCRADRKPTINHCVESVDSHQGTPINDAWWQELMIGFIGCALEVDPDIQHAHIWNEPGTKLWVRDGEYYSQFYFDTVKAIKAKYPQMKMSGPVLWGPPITGLNWENYFKELMDKVVITENRKDLLDYIDFHAYIHSNTGGLYARWDHLLNSIHAISHYYRVITSGANIRSVVTETNVDLNGWKSSYSDPVQGYWNDRCMANAKSIMALSFSPDKLKIRQQFDMGASGYAFNGQQDTKMYDVMKAVNDGFQVSFSFGTVENGYPHFDNGDCIMTQTIYNEGTNSITTILINYCDSDKKVTLKDTDKKISFSRTARFANRWQVNNAYSVGIGSYQVWATAKAQSITAITGTYNTVPTKGIEEIEFISNDKSMVMRPSNPQTKDVLSVTYYIKLINVPTNNNYEYAYIKFGFFDSLMTDFKYTIQLKGKNGANTYLTITDYIPTMEYMEFPVKISTLSSEIYNGNTLQIVFTGTRIQTGKKWWKDWAGRIVFASVVCGFGDNSLSTGSYLRVSNKPGLSSNWYAVRLSNIPNGHEIQYVKMKDSKMISWETGIKKWDYYYFAGNTPYSAPFSFKIRSSTTGQEIISYKIITDLNENSYGTMTQLLSNAGSYTDDSQIENENGLSVATIIVIVMAILIVIGILIVGTCYMIKKRKKMKDAVQATSVMDKNVDDDGDDIKGYDMSPIDIKEKDEDSKNKETEQEEQEKETLEIDYQIEQ